MRVSTQVGADEPEHRDYSTRKDARRQENHDEVREQTRTRDVKNSTRVRCGPRPQPRNSMSTLIPAGGVRSALASGLAMRLVPHSPGAQEPTSSDAGGELGEGRCNRQWHMSQWHMTGTQARHAAWLGNVSRCPQSERLRRPLLRVSQTGIASECCHCSLPKESPALEDLVGGRCSRTTPRGTRFAAAPNTISDGR